MTAILHTTPHRDIEGTDEVTTIPDSLGVCDKWWLFRPFNSSGFPRRISVTEFHLYGYLDFRFILVQTIHSLDQYMHEDSPRFLPGTLYMLILRTVSAGPLHGYAITRRIKQCSADVLNVDEGSLYPALNRMLLKGWLRAEWGISETNRKVRLYKLTKEGQNQLASEANDFDKLVKAIQLVMRTA